jgi:hypothetical protein
MSNPELNSWLEKGVLLNYLGVEFVGLDPDRVIATMPVDERHHQQVGYLHGGVNVFLAETVAGIGAMLNCSPGKTALGSEVNASPYVQRVLVPYPRLLPRCIRAALPKFGRSGSRMRTRNP